MNHLVAFYSSAVRAGVYHYITPVPDETVAIDGDDIRVIRDMPNLMGVGFMSAADTVTSAKINTPSLRALVLPKFEPIVNAVKWGSEPAISMKPDDPTPLVVDEGMKAELNSSDAAAKVEYCLAWFCDGKQSVSTGRMFSVRATGSASLSAGQWVNTAIVLEDDLPVGDYAVVGLRARGVNLVAARIFFKGGFFRPGVPAVNTTSDRDPDFFRNGQIGQLGTFHSTVPPSIDCLGVTDTTQSFILDLIKI